MSTDFTWHCNALKCRTVLQNRAVVTTCSHIFCLTCAETQGLASSNNGVRICPACNTQLVNQDDAIITQLDPSEDYKTSVLSGMHPSIIMECAGRGLAFYTYQVSNEITYQTYLAASLTDKYSQVNNQLDTIITQANGQIKKLQDALKDSQGRAAEVDKKNWELQDAYKDKAKAYQELHKKYNLLKNDKMKDQVIDAASDDAELVLNTVRGNRFMNQLDPRVSYGAQHAGQAHGQRRPLSASSEEIEAMRAQRGMPAPLWNSQARTTRGYTGQSQVQATPSSHRTRLPMAARGPGLYTAEGASGLHRHSANDLFGNAYGPSGTTGNRMSAGVKMGKQRPSTRTNAGMRPPDLPIR